MVSQRQRSSEFLLALTLVLTPCQSEPPGFNLERMRVADLSLRSIMCKSVQHRFDEFFDVRVDFTV